MTQTWPADQLERYLKEGKRRVDAMLEGVLARAGDHPRAGAVGAAMRHALFCGGKRLRPILTLEVARLLGEREQRVECLAGAVELIHTCSLVLDDLPAMDDAVLRRGQATVHRAFDEATAILAANALLMLAFAELASADLPARTALRISGAAAECVGIAGMVGGQAADLALMRAGVDLATVEYIHANKTGKLFILSLVEAARACRASEVQLAALEGYARNLGLAFQVTDDLLDVQGDAAQVGKDLHQDEGRTTFVDLGGIDQSRRLVAELVATAKASLALFDERADPLRALADFVESRRY